MTPQDLTKPYVRSAGGKMIPLSSVVTVSTVIGAEQLERYNGFIAAKVMGNGVTGISSGDAIATVERIAAQTLPDGYSLAWTGQAFQEKRTGSTSVLAFGFGIVMVFLILAAQYERWSLPLAVVMAVPFAQLAHELQRGRADLVVGGRWLEVEERPDVTAHDGLRGCFVLRMGQHGGLSTG
jgi:multidrug efflux pump subunit AcrB